MCKTKRKQAIRSKKKQVVMKTNTQTIYMAGQKTLFWGVDNFATVNERKTCDMSKVSEFCPEKNWKTYMSLDLNILCLVFINIHCTCIMLKLTKMNGHVAKVTALIISTQN